VLQWIYHTHTKNSLHRAHSLQVTRGQSHDFLSLRWRTVIGDPIPRFTVYDEVR